MSFVEPTETTTRIRNLRKWCYANTKSPWSTFHLRGVDRDPHTDCRIGFVAFEFDSEKEAMKFQLYAGE